MSHYTNVSTQFANLATLRRALGQMNLTLLDCAPCRYYYGTTTENNVVKLPGQYDMFFKENGKYYDLIADFYNSHVERVIGSNGCIVKQFYAIETIKEEAAKHHFTCKQISSNTFRLEDPADSAEQYLIAKFDSEGNVNFEAHGFSGGNCLKFSSVEKALGDASSEYKDCFYESADERVYLDETGY